MTNEELGEAIREGDLGAVERAVAGGVALDEADEEGLRPLEIAVQAREDRDFPSATPILDALLEAGADATGGARGRGPLIDAAVSGDVAAAKRLLEAGANANRVVLESSEEHELGLTAALIAWEDENEVAELLLPDGTEQTDVAGAWVLVRMEYPSGPMTPWGHEEPYLRPGLEFDASGGFRGVDAFGEARGGRVTLDGGRMTLVDREYGETDVVLEARGSRLIEERSDEQTGFRGAARFVYVRASMVAGLPDVGKILED